MSFSDRGFPTEVVAVWRSLDAIGKAALVRPDLDDAGFREIQTKVLADARRVTRAAR